MQSEEYILKYSFKAHSARGRLRDKHQIKLKDKLAKLKAEQMEKAVEEGVNEELDPRDAMMARSKERAADKPSSASGSREASEAEEESEDEGEKMVNATIEEYEAGGYSPILLTIDELEKGTVTYMEEEDVAKRNFDQGKALGGKEVKGKATEQERDMENQARKGMGQDEAQFSVESMLEQSYDWSDKYRPRKPRYFNRVHTGFEWNKYNQTHYDFDNPPPKIVQVKSLFLCECPLPIFSIRATNSTSSILTSSTREKRRLSKCRQPLMVSL